MKIIILIYCLTIIDLVLSTRMEDFVKEFTKKIQPNRVTLYSDFADEKINDCCKFQSIFKHLITQVPTVTVNIKRAFYVPDFKINEITYFRNYSAPLHIIVLNEYYFFEKLSFVLNIIKKSLFYLTTTKIFLLFKSMNDIQNIVKYFFTIAWDSKFLDFTIVLCDNNYSDYIVIYESFTGVGVDLSIKNTMFFADEFKDIKGYPLNVGVLDALWPHMYLNYTHNFLQFESLYLFVHLFRAFKTFAEFYGLRTTFIPLPNNENINKLIRNFKLDCFLGKIMMFPEHNILHTFMVEPTRIVVLAPKIYEKSIENYNGILYSFLLIIGIIFLVLFCVYWFKFRRDEWSPENIFNLLLGNGVDITFSCLRSKIIYAILCVVSFFFVSDLIIDLTTLKYENKQISLVDSVEDILDKNLPVICRTSKILLSLIIVYAQGSVKKLAETAFLPEFITPTPEFNRYRIFISLADDAEKVMRKAKFADNLKYEIKDFNILESYYVVGFSENSPFRYKFAVFHTRILEAGLDLKWRSDYDNCNKIDKRIERDNIDEDEDTLILTLLIVMIGGVIISLITLVLECIWYYYLSKKLQRTKIGKLLKLSTPTPPPVSKMKIRKIKVKPQKEQINITV